MVKTTCKSNSGHALVNTVIFWLPCNEQIVCEKPWHPTCDSQAVQILHICKYIQGEACLKLPSTSLTSCDPFNFAQSKYSFYLWLAFMGYPSMWGQMRLFILSTETSNWCKLLEVQVTWIANFLLADRNLDTWRDKKNMSKASILSAPSPACCQQRQWPAALYRRHVFGGVRPRSSSCHKCRQYLLTIVTDVSQAVTVQGVRMACQAERKQNCTTSLNHLYQSTLLTRGFHFLPMGILLLHTTACCCAV